MKIRHFHISAPLHGVSGEFHSHEDRYEIHYVVKGAGWFEEDGRRIHFRNNALFLSTPNSTHNLWMDKAADQSLMYIIGFEPGHGQMGIMRRLLKQMRRDGVIHMNPASHYDFNDMHRKAHAEDPDLQASGRFLFISFLHELASDNIDEIRSHPAVFYATQYMRSQIYGEVNIEDLAQHLEMSKSYFTRIFKKYEGETPHRYYLKLKIETAAFLLRTTQFPIYQIANQLNFTDEFHFSRTFKQHQGVSPRDYRAKPSL